MKTNKKKIYNCKDSDDYRRKVNIIKKKLKLKTYLHISDFILKNF